MSKSYFKVVVKTPTSVMFTGEIQKLGVITKDGRLTIYPNHANLVTLLDLGFITIHQEGEEKEVFCFEGLMKIENGDVVILTEDAKVPSEALLSEIEAAIKVAKEGVQESDKHSISVESLLKAEIQLRYRLGKKRK